MKHLPLICLILALILHFTKLPAQELPFNNSNTWYFYEIYYANLEKDKNKQEHVRQRIITTNSRFRTTRVAMNYDTAGRVSSYQEGKWSMNISYYKDELRRETVVFKKGRLIERDSMDWDANKLLSRYYFNKRNRITGREQYRYDSIYPVEFIFDKYRRGRFRENRRRITEYYSDHSVKKITYYKKGKPHNYIVFDCNPTGENHRIKKDSSYNCVKYELDSLGNKIKTDVSNWKKQSRKTVTYYNQKDQRIACRVYDQKKDQILNSMSFKPGSPWHTSYVWYKHGKERYRTETRFDDNDNCTSWSAYRKGRMINTALNRYNEKQQLESTEHLNRRNKVKSRTTYQYSYY